MFRNMNAEQINPKVTTVPSGVDGAVGVPEAKWFVAIVNSRHEKSVAEKLENLGYNTYVATQKELHIWKNGRRKNDRSCRYPIYCFYKLFRSNPKRDCNAPIHPTFYG